jgi:capsular polysaccharide biosynthesis protein
MEFFDFIKLIKKKWGTITTLVFLIVVITVGLSLLNPLKYSAHARLLVVQNTAGADPYTVSKSNEYLGNLFSEVVHSGSFYNFVLDSQYNIDRNYFSGSYDKQMKMWQKTVQTKTLSDTGIIEINVYHTDPTQAQQIALAVNEVLISKNTNYQGSGQVIKVNIIDQPLISSYPVKPNIIQNSILALAGGLMFSLFFIYLFPEERYNVRLWSARRPRKSKSINHRIKIDYYPLPSEPNPTNEERGIASDTEPEEYRPQGSINNVLR